MGFVKFYGFIRYPLNKKRLATMMVANLFGLGATFVTTVAGVFEGK